jgi:long-chain acyl-CoA synthetase
MYFITGATGFLGSQLLARLLVSEPKVEFAVLVRARDQNEARKRIRRVLEETFSTSSNTSNSPDSSAASTPSASTSESESYYLRDALSRVRVVCGDLCEEDFGLGSDAFTRLAKEVRTIYHCAASTSLDQKLEDARQANVASTRQVLRLAELAQSFSNSQISLDGTSESHENIVRLHHVSTAYVAGNTERTVKPSELRRDVGFRNAYEQSKAESEWLVRSASDRLQTTIYRPSIVVGDSITGQTSAFNVLYVPVRFILSGLLNAVPARPTAPFDVVPIDYVADAIQDLSKISGESGTCYHLCAGIGRESSPAEILDLVIRTAHLYTTRKLHVPAFVSPELITRAISSFSAAYEGLLQLEKLVSDHLKIFRKTVPFIPYMITNPRFDCSQTTSALSGIHKEAPLFTSYAEQIFCYCLETDWGRSPWTNPNKLRTWAERLPCPA